MVKKYLKKFRLIEYTHSHIKDRTTCIKLHFEIELILCKKSERKLVLKTLSRYSLPLYTLLVHASVIFKIVRDADDLSVDL